MFCPSCGSELADDAKFCPACGASATGDTGAKPAAAPATQPAAEKVPFGKRIEPHFITIYVVLGLLGYLLASCAWQFITVSGGFGVALGVFALLFGICYLVIGIIGKFCVERSAGEGSKVRYGLLFAISIVVFLAVFLSCIALFITYSDLNAVADALNIFG